MEGRCLGSGSSSSDWLVEGVGNLLGILHQLVRVPDVGQAEPEHGPAAVGEATVTMFEVPWNRWTRSIYKAHLTQRNVVTKLLYGQKYKNTLISEVCRGLT